VTVHSPITSLGASCCTFSASILSIEVSTDGTGEDNGGRGFSFRCTLYSVIAGRSRSERHHKQGTTMEAVLQ
jgi:hypothetical protein